MYAYEFANTVYVELDNNISDAERMIALLESRIKNISLVPMV